MSSAGWQLDTGNRNEQKGRNGAKVEYAERKTDSYLGPKERTQSPRPEVNHDVAGKNSSSRESIMEERSLRAKKEPPSRDLCHER